MPPGAVAQNQVHIGQLERRRAAQLVGPAQLAVKNRDLGLGKHPVGGRVVTAAAAALDGKARDVDLAFCIAAHIELGTVQVQLLETEMQKRAWRDRRHHLRKAQCLTTARVKQLHIGELQSGDQIIAAR